MPPSVFGCALGADAGVELGFEVAAWASAAGVVGRIAGVAGERTRVLGVSLAAPCVPSFGHVACIGAPNAVEGVGAMEMAGADGIPLLSGVCTLWIAITSAAASRRARCMSASAAMSAA